MDDTPLGIALPTDRDEAGTRLMHLTKQGEVPCFWCANPKGWLLSDGRPEGTRPHPDVATVFWDQMLMSKGQVELRYKDGVKTRVFLEELGHGRILMPAEVCEKWTVCDDGYVDLRGRKHGSE